MKVKKLVAFFFVVFLLISQVYPAFAIVDPFSVPNNKIGVHILFSTELQEAAELVNSNGGDWGYVTIPIQAGDKDLVKWQKFMDDAGEYHLIPILRLATENYYFNTRVWRKPKEEDILDFANFLNSLQWPVRNRYVIIFNEVNRSDEWGSPPNPSEYAQLLQYAITVFKSKSQDFFILPAGLDNAAATTFGTSMNQYEFIQQVNQAVPGIFNQVDGITSHSYPNPGFLQSPSRRTKQSITSFSYEKDLIYSLSNKVLPVFITETGWSKDEISENIIASYYEEAFKDVWSDEAIVAITPFILKADAGPFTAFSLIMNNKKNVIYEAIKDLPKIKGKPVLSEEVLGNTNLEIKSAPLKDFSGVDDNKVMESSIIVSEPIRTLFKILLQIRP